MNHILIIEDDKALSNGISLALQNGDMILELCYDIKSGREKLSLKAYDLLILDINLPDGNGLSLLQEVKEKYPISVILLTANDMETDIVTGLEMGADDYITKPFSLAVLRARVNTQIRKRKAGFSNRYSQDALVFNFVKMEFYKNFIPLELSKTEQKLLKILVDNRGNTVKRSTLVDYVWTSGAEYVDENALSVTIKRLRNKLEDTPSNPRYIKTVYGLGYMWNVK